MRTSAKVLVAIALAAGAVSSAVAQQGPGWDVAWGTAQPVPLSPWATALLGLLLVAATYAFLRLRSKQGGVALMAAAAILGSTYLTDDLWAIAPYDLTISTPSGSAFVSCGNFGAGSAQEAMNGIADIVVGTTLQEGVILRRVDPSIPPPAASAATPTAIANECSVGLRVTPGAPCTLPCRPI
jgi:hypothetical protein